MDYVAIVCVCTVHLASTIKCPFKYSMTAILLLNPGPVCNRLSDMQKLLENFLRHAQSGPGRKQHAEIETTVNRDLPLS